MEGNCNNNIDIINQKSDKGYNAVLLGDDSEISFKYCLIKNDDKKSNAGESIKGKHNIEVLLSDGVEHRFLGINDEVFSNNLVVVDSYMEKILSWMVLFSYAEGSMDSEKLIEILENRNPLGYNRYGMYKHKYKKLLYELAIRKNRNECWAEITESERSSLCKIFEGLFIDPYLRNRNAFEDYLLRTTKLEAASTERHDYAKIFKENGQYYMNLNLQIRFDA